MLLRKGKMMGNSFSFIFYWLIVIFNNFAAKESTTVLRPFSCNGLLKVCLL